MEFIAPVPAAQIKDDFYAALDPERAGPVDWVPERDERKPETERETYRVLEDTHTLTGRRKSDPPLTMRRILVHSTAVAAGQRAARARRLAKAAADLDRLTTAAGGQHDRTREKITARIGVITAKRRVTSCLRWEITAGENGAPSLVWHFDQDVLTAEAAVDGWHALITSLPPEKGGPDQVLIHYKGQGAVERRYHDFKGPLAVAPVFVQHNRRVRPTGRMILYHLGELTLRIGNVTDPPTVQINCGVQLHLLDLLDTDIGQTRWPQT